MSSRYMDSVPFLQSRQMIEGFIWAVNAEGVTPAMVLASCGPGISYIGTLPGGVILVAGSSNQKPTMPDAAVNPWCVQLYNDVTQSIPLAFLEDDGDGNGSRYVQLESFSIGLDGESPEELPVVCKFLIGKTNAGTHVCADE